MENSRTSKAVILAAWIVLLLTSMLPRVVLQEIFGLAVPADFQVVLAAGVVAAAWLATVVWPALRGLRPYLVIVLVLAGSQWLVYNHLDRLPFFRARLSSAAFNTYILAEMALNLVVTLVILTALFLMSKKRADIYLAVGDIAAPAQPIPWLGVKPGESWKTLGLWLTFFISLGTLAFLVLAGRPPLDLVVRALPFLPVVLLASALNAFNEEVTYKASFLSVLEGPVGPRQALYMVAAYFGLAHFYGVPYGVTGVAMAAFLGWILARSMQETRGLFWAWFIHFWQDVWIFSFLAIGSIVPGGG